MATFSKDLCMDKLPTLISPIHLKGQDQSAFYTSFRHKASHTIGMVGLQKN